MLAEVLNGIYILLVTVISLYGLHALVITALYLRHHRTNCPPPTMTENWPLVSVQLPFYNEMYVATRMIDTACRLDYPRDRLLIQVLDDSTDGTTELVRQRVEQYRQQGYQIELIHRTRRTGYKAGALARGLDSTPAEFLAVFDADFLPPPDFLLRVIPYFFTNPRIGMVQTRWGHLNRESNLITQTQALYLDGHQIVEQVARSRSGLLCNFNGSGGVWRAECVRDSGGWQWDTLSEDIDLSFRAQMHGWKMMFLPDLVVPAEIPPSMSIFKKQQFRWNYGYAQAFRKLIRRLWVTPGLSLPQRIGGSFQLSTNVAQLFGLGIFLLSVPLALLNPTQPSSLGLISVASSGPSILFAVSQLVGYRDPIIRRLFRMLHWPLLIMMTVGTAASNCWAVINALSGRQIGFERTPKYNLEGKENGWHGAKYKVPVQPSTWVELGLSIYCMVGFILAWQRAPELIPLTVLGMLSFGFVGGSSLVENLRVRKKTVAVLKSEP